MKAKYNLNLWQRLSLPLLWLIWICRPIDKRKTWHELKKGLETHTHTFGDIYLYKGHKYRDCTHEGCNICTAMDDDGNWLDPI